MKQFATAALCICLAAPAQARGWDYFASHIHPTGRCGLLGREVAASRYSTGTWTSTGERINFHALAAASNVGGFWPPGRIVSIFNLATGRRVTVRINDKLPNNGPAWRAGDRLDLTPAAFAALGMTASAWVCAW